MVLTAARPNKIPIVCLIIIVALATALRLYHLAVPSLWFDEDVSVVVATGHWKSIFYTPAGYYEHAPDLASPHSLQPLYELFGEAESHPPFYSFCLRGWWALFGMSDESCRMMSVVLSVLAVLVVFDLGRLIGGTTAGVWAAALLAVSPLQIRYAQEVRDYPLLGLLAAGACDAIIRIVTLGPTRWRWIALALCVTLATETHYMILTAVAGLGWFGWMRLRGRDRRIVISIIAFALISVVAIRLPVILHNWKITQAEAEPLNEERSGLVLRTIARLASMPMSLLLSPRTDAKISGSAAVIVLILPFFLERRRPGLLLCGLWACGVIGMVATSDIVLGHKALLNVRYSLSATPALVVIVAVLADLGGKWLRHTLPVLAIIGALLAVPSVYADEIWEKTEARQWAADVQSSVRPGDVLVVASEPGRGLYRAGLEYLQLAHYAYPFPCDVAVVEGPASQELRDRIWSHPHVWMAICQYAISPVDSLGPCKIVKDGKQWAFAGRVIRVERETTTASTRAANSSSEADAF